MSKNNKNPTILVGFLHNRTLKARWWVGKDSNLGRREPKDLQSFPFDRFGTYP